MAANSKEQALLAPPKVGIIMGSESDERVMKEAEIVLNELWIPSEMKIVSAHRTPDLMFEYASSAEGRGLEVIIAGAGGAAHLPGMTASKTRLPVIAVPIESRSLKGLDSLLSIVQMPLGVDVNVMGINEAGNAGFSAARILGRSNMDILYRLDQNRDRIIEIIKARRRELF